MKSVEFDLAMREGMRRLASGVCVVTAKGKDGSPYAMTATSVTSLSDSPPSLLVCINKSARMFEAIDQGSDFCINLLAYGQDEISNRCASGDQGVARFDVGAWSMDKPLPYLSDGLAAFFCRQDRAIDYGTHRIVIGNIEEVLVNDDDSINPLLYLNGGYHKLA